MILNFLKVLVGFVVVFCFVVCSGGGMVSLGFGEMFLEDGGEVVCINFDLYLLIYEFMVSGMMLIQNVIIFDGLGGQIDDGDVLIENGLILVVGVDFEVFEGVIVIDVAGCYVMLGVIDIYFYLGVYFLLGVGVYFDGNEVIQLVIVEVWVEYFVWFQDFGFEVVLVGGVIILYVLFGFVNLFGGCGVILCNVFGWIVQEMKFFDVFYMLKMVCGENLLCVYGNCGMFLVMDMGNMVGYCVVWQCVFDYCDDWYEYWDVVEVGEDVFLFCCDFELDIMMGVLEGEVLVQMYCYWVDQMVQIMDFVCEFDYQVIIFYYVVEVYKIFDLLVENGVCVVVWVDWGGFKMEVYDLICENFVFLYVNGVCVMIYFDDFGGIQCFNQEIVKVFVDGCCVGIEIFEVEVWIWVVNNLVIVLGIVDQIGLLQLGFWGDVVFWFGNFYSVYICVDQVWIDGVMVFNWVDEFIQLVCDFMFG